jgi:hypothetical protein
MQGRENGTGSPSKGKHQADTRSSTSSVSLEGTNGLIWKLKLLPLHKVQKGVTTPRRHINLNGTPTDTLLASCSISPPQAPGPASRKAARAFHAFLA